MSKLVFMLIFSFFCYVTATFDFCGLVKDDFPTGTTCLQPSRAGDELSFKVDYSKVITPSNIQGIGQIPKLTFDFELDFDACAAAGASVDVSASLKLPAVPALLSTAISDAVNVVDEAGFKALSYTTNDHTLTVSQTLSASKGISVYVPVFYVDVASVDLKVTGTLSGNADSLSLAFTLDVCIEFKGDDVKELFPNGGKICASELPDCRTCTTTAAKTCTWVGTTFPCVGTTGYHDSCSIDPLTGGNSGNVEVNTKRTAANVACAFLGGPDLRSMLDNPPWTIVSKTWSLGDACTAPTPRATSPPASGSSTNAPAAGAAVPSSASSAGVDVEIFLVVIVFLVVGILVAFRLGYVQGKVRDALMRVPLVRQLEPKKEVVTTLEIENTSAL